MTTLAPYTRTWVWVYNIPQRIQPIDQLQPSSRPLIDLGQSYTNRILVNLIGWCCVTVLNGELYCKVYLYLQYFWCRRLTIPVRIRFFKMQIGFILSTKIWIVAFIALQLVRK